MSAFWRWSIQLLYHGGNTRVVTKVIENKSIGLVLHFLNLSDVTFVLG